jgi:hypothetical protein
MTDHSDAPTDTPPPEPPAPPPPAPVRKKRGGWIVAGILALVLGVLVALYYMGIFDGGRRREEVPWNAASASAQPEPTLPDNALTGNLTEAAPADNAAAAAAPTNNMAAAAAPTPRPDRVTAEWLAGNWGQYCPGSAREILVFLPGGSYSGVGGMGSWTLNGNIVTLHINGRNLDMRWDYLTQDSARVTRQRTGQSYTLYRCL